MGRTQKKIGTGGADRRAAGDGDDADLLFYLRTKYTLLGKAEWWWLMDESLAEISRRLETEHFVVIDGFLSRDAVSDLRDEIRSADDAGHLAPGVLAGGKAGDATQYTMRDVRGDRVGWFSGAETDPGLRWSRLPEAMKRADTLVNELGGLGGEARHVASRSKAMCTVYPGEGARYVRHVDNPDANGRLLTALIYLNPEWEEGDGGELRVFRCLRDAAAAAAAGFVDCDGRSLARADEYDVIVKKNADPSNDATLVATGPRDVAEGVRDVATLRPAEEGTTGDSAASAAKPVRLTDVAPIGGRLVLFKSDARVPHEVLASRAPRYAVTLWYFHGEQVREARRKDAATEEERAAQEAKIAREIATMSLKYGGDSGRAPEVRVRRSRADDWRQIAVGESSASKSSSSRTDSEFGIRGVGHSSGSNASNASSPFPPTPPLPLVPPPCEATWEGVGRDRALVVRVPLPAGTKAGSCAAETEAGSRLVLSAPGVPDGTVVVHLPEGADANAVEIKLVKKPERALTVRVACPAPHPDLDPEPEPEPEAEAEPEPEPEAEPEPTPSRAERGSPETPLDRAGEDCVGVGGTLSWSADTEFTPLPPAPPRRPGVAPRGVDLRDAVDWEDFVQVRWSLAGIEDARPVLTPHALDALSFPVTLAWALQLETTRDALRAARAAAETAGHARVSAAVAAAAEPGSGSGSEPGSDVGDGDPAAVPTTVIIAGASARTEQFILDHTAYWRETIVAAPQPRGGVHLAFVGPDARDAAIRRLAPSLTASARRETVGSYLARLPDEAPAVVIGFNTGMGGGGGALARGWAADLVRTLSRPNTPAAFTAANDYADLRGELAAFRALGAKFAVEPSANPFRAYTHTVGEGEGPAGLRERPKDATEGGERWSCANAFRYVVRGFADGRGPSAGLTDAQLCALATGAAERAAGAAWDALGMRR